MKKKIAAVLILSTLLVGTVYASSINGDYKGNPIVKVKSNGRVIPVEDTPAVIYDDRTMVPIYLLKSLGADVKWNQSDYSVDINLPIPSQANTDIDLFRSYANIADLYRNIGTTSKHLKDYNQYLSLYFTGENWELQNRITENELSEQLDTYITVFNAVSNSYNNQKDIYQNFGIETAKTALQKNYDAIDQYKLAISSLGQWKTYRNTDTQKSQNGFNDYLKYRNTGFELSSQGESLSNDGYRKFMDAMKK
jgi:hypothetical protein